MAIGMSLFEPFDKIWSKVLLAVQIKVLYSKMKVKAQKHGAFVCFRVVLNCAVEVTAQSKSVNVLK